MSLLFLFGGLLAAYYALHSLLAAEAAKTYLQKHLVPAPYYRLGFNLVFAVLLLPLGVLFSRLAPLALLVSPWPWLSWLGAAMVFLGIGLLWLALKQYNLREFAGTEQLAGTETAKEKDALRTGGLNAYVRHPIYSATLLLLWGLVAALPDAKYLLVASVTHLYVLIGARLEEQKLVRTFGAAYIAYRQEVPMLWPRLRWPRVLSLLPVLALPGCEAPAPPRTISPAIYHWKTAFAPTDYEWRVLDSLGIKTIYARFFDLDIEAGRDGIVPLAPIVVPAVPTVGIDIVPAIFITHRSMAHISVGELDTLAARAARKVVSLHARVSTASLREVQLDCDWTETTRERFFGFLSRMRHHLADSYGTAVTISATIRLHQFRHPEMTGVPPADRGMLMFYNMGSVGELAEPNSVLNLSEAQRYLRAKPYPIPLGLALPLFRWGVVYRDDRLMHLINDLGAEALADTARFEKVAAEQYQVNRNTFLDGYYLYQGDHLRLEGVDIDSLRRAAQLLQPLDWPSGLALAWYHLDSSTLSRFSVSELRSVQAALGMKH